MAKDLNQRQRNALTKARIKMRRAKSLREVLHAYASGMAEAVILGVLERQIIEGDGWIARRVVIHSDLPIARRLEVTANG